MNEIQYNNGLSQLVGIVRYTFRLYITDVYHFNWF